ncbi:unnamed protein product [Phytophthora lilii]|uniref:Unnamed protein product n=1 Tax=Phytophthora lilii TaxID=2077276 RepID=A0A9W6TUJ7_9STRA|nr:unnamed protein product [Phytophthora lilii]
MTRSRRPQHQTYSALGNSSGGTSTMEQRCKGAKWMLGHMRCSKRLNRSLGAVLGAMTCEDGSGKWPVTPTARDIGITAEIRIQTLQQFDDSPYIIVRSYSGDINFRYMCLVQQRECDPIDGKRVLKFYYVVGDSEANGRSRTAATSSEQEVVWITDGGYSLTLIEVDDDAVDAEFNSFGCCAAGVGPLHNVRPRWEQLVMSSKRDS